MTENMVLLGAQDVLTASRAIREAAHEMQTAASTITEALRRHEQFLDEWLQRLELAVKPS